MRIALVAGSYPPSVCGVADYTERLTTALRSLGLSVEVVTGKDWRMSRALSVRKDIRALGCDVTHIQYPSVGYGRKLGPQMLGLLERGVVTVHEASKTHSLRQLSLYPFFLARHVIFTNIFERSHVQRFAPWIAKASSIIPIGSNISAGKNEREPSFDEIVYFGLIRPEKGLEAVLALAALVKARRSRKKIRIVGLALKEHADYLRMLQAQSQDLPVIWQLGLPEVETAEVLARSAFGYVPFPDGASERRGSLLALLANGVATVTTHGEHTPRGLDGSVLYAASPEEAVRIFENLTEHKDKYGALSQRGRHYAEQFSWSSIGEKHRLVYQAIVDDLRPHRGRMKNS